MIKTSATLVLVALLSATGLSVSGIESAAAQSNHEEFHSNQSAEDAARKAQILRATTVPENPMGKAGPLAIMSNPNDPTVRWFEDFDKTVAASSKTSQEVTILKRPFNQESERVAEWSSVAAKVAGKYKYLAMVLKNMHTPPNKDDVRDFARLTAGWFADSAAIYDDLLKPRRAAKTQEELDAGLNAIYERAKALKAMQSDLLAMDMGLRKKYSVHTRTDTDPLQQYILGNPTAAEVKSVGGKPLNR
ncbi:MAG: hypothetical protein SGJ27_16690 [Candidatus Melainabacteria bacterium]|nr:hypothetical protein [Candidatus Melainabacteria bacterium]